MLYSREIDARVYDACAAAEITSGGPSLESFTTLPEISAKRSCESALREAGYQRNDQDHQREPKIAPGEFELAGLPELIGKDNPVILDVGSNDGSATLEFLRLFREPKIYSFEPDPRALERFKSKVTDERVKLLEVAISDTDGTAKFYMSNGLPSPDWAELLPKGWDASGSIRMPKRHLDAAPWCRFDESITVATKRLDTWFREEGIGMIDFIWADLQGAEIDLIRGGRCALEHTRYFYTEYSDQELY